ncbi:MAG: sugar ABC transporter ATP-binding protein [Chloroflexi bacterium]|nr:sugar ABC transporter ATP-binding protein [Chloroflexota bacterium]
MSATAPSFELQGISKAFSGVQALDNVSFDVLPGEVHALVGENGAGKSTLIKIISGVYQPDEGMLLVEGQPVHLGTPHEAQAAGVSAVHQELNMQPYLSIAENIYLGRQPYGRFGLIDFRQLNRMATDLLQQLGIDLDPKRTLEELTVAQRQMVSIARAISVNARLIIFDEPTAALTQRETELLFAIIRRLKERRIGIVYISHRLEEITELADRVTVLRDGKHIRTAPIDQFSVDQIVSMMVGRDISDLFRKHDVPIGGPVLEVLHLSTTHALEDISLTLHAGEILGIAGLVGAGRTELARAIFGADRISSGEILLLGQRLNLRSPRDAIRSTIALVPEERKQQGLVVEQSINDNIGLPNLSRMFRRGVINIRKQAALSKEYVDRLAIRTPSIDQHVKFLSGGNQQRVVLAKWLATQPRVLILDEPTRGIDVAAKADIHDLMCQLAAQGVGILMISSDLPEVLAMSDRILVMRRGRIAGEFSRRDATQEAILRVAAGEGAA